VEHVRIDISQDLDGDAVVHACFDLSPDEIAAAAHAVAATTGDRFRMTNLSADDVLELRELTALTDELAELTGGASTVVLKPARLSALRDAVIAFVESREQAEWIREEDRQPLALLREMLFPLEQLSAEATRAALSPLEHRPHG
jgi:peptidoglycan/xylan/chitin deacetylase (PgdA/CDA1 family)